MPLPPSSANEGPAMLHSDSIREEDEDEAEEEGDVGHLYSLLLVQRNKQTLQYKHDVVSAGKKFTKISKAITGFFFHAARKDPQEGYRTLVENQPVYIHPSKQCSCGSQTVTVIDTKWLVELAPRPNQDEEKKDRRGSNLYMVDTMSPTPGVSVSAEHNSSALGLRQRYLGLSPQTLTQRQTPNQTILQSWLNGPLVLDVSYPLQPNLRKFAQTLRLRWLWQDLTDALDLPKWAIKAIDKRRKGVLWSGQENANGGNCLVSSEKVQRLLQFGGLGILNLETMGWALRIRWLWLQRTFSARPWEDPPIQIPRNAEALFAAAVNVNVGNGEDTLFWIDRWLNASSVAELAPNLVMIVSNNARKQCTVAQALTNRRWATDIQGSLTVQVLVEYLKIWEMVDGMSLQPDIADQRFWKFTRSSLYTSKSAYNAFFFGAIKFGPWKRVRKTWAPLRCKFFIWLAIKNTCWTADRLAKRGLPHPSVCPLCDQEKETIQHLLVPCVCSREVWAYFLHALGLSAVAPQSDTRIFSGWWSLAANRVSGELKRVNSLIILVAWELWKHRNACVFEGASLIVSVVLQEVEKEGSLWCLAGNVALSELRARLVGLASSTPALGSQTRPAPSFLFGGGPPRPRLPVVSLSATSSISEGAKRKTVESYPSKKNPQHYPPVTFLSPVPVCSNQLSLPSLGARLYHRQPLPPTGYSSGCFLSRRRSPAWPSSRSGGAAPPRRLLPRQRGLARPPSPAADLRLSRVEPRHAPPPPSHSRHGATGASSPRPAGWAVSILLIRIRNGVSRAETVAGD
ncbi:hypothetical protein U9M48_018809 [Paspalum notatum var. saurae]|uniref:Reverse transcriptase zinc-binding domain-containing protein n=1 Tax=Paspalum notatum var. saurae TaxID=547442 RepID=A0AAQ3TCN8_PASNO